MRIADDHLTTLGEIYRRNPALRLCGLSFYQFAHYPDDCLRLFVYNADQPRPDDDTETEFLPPLPSQLAVGTRVEQDCIIQDAVADLDLDADLQREYPEAGRHGDRLTAPIHRRKPPRRYKVGSHKRGRAA